MIKLHQFPPMWGLPNPSPFCMKVETYLRMADIAYEAIATSPRSAPKGKLPFIEDEGTRISDSGFIVDYLKGRYGDKLDAELSARELGLAHAVRRMLEENLYWVAVYDRWISDVGWEVSRPAFFQSLPLGARQLIPPVVRRSLRGALHAQGIGRHTPEEIHSIGKQDVTALASLLGDNKFFLGAKPSSIDASIYPFVAGYLWAPVPSPVKTHVASLKNLVGYAERMRDRYYADSDDKAARPAQSV